MFNLVNIAKAQQAPIGGIVKCGPQALGYAEECGKEHFWQLIHDLISYGLYIAIIAVGLAVVYSGAMVMISRGGEQLGKGKAALKASIVGLLIALTAWLIVNTIITTLLPECFGEWNIFSQVVCQNP